MPVGTERDTAHKTGVPGQRGPDRLLAGVGVPDAQGLSPLPETIRVPSGLNATL